MNNWNIFSEIKYYYINPYPQNKKGYRQGLVVTEMRTLKL